MGGYEYDRQSFARVAEPEPRPRPAFSIPGPLILLALFVAIGFAAYPLFKAYEGNGTSSNGAGLRRIEHRLDVLEKRVDRLDAASRVSHAKRLGRTGNDDPAERGFRTTSSSTREASGAQASLSPDVLHLPPAAPRSISPHQAGSARLNTGPNQGIRQPTAVGDHEEWEATANRLGDIVGELATERNDIDRTQERLGRLSDLLGRSSTPFVLRKGAKPQQVGPIRLRLQNTDPKNARYTMRLFAGDESIELKDRALNEVIQFYISGGADSFELVVSQIGRNVVSGRLSLPIRTSAK